MRSGSHPTSQAGSGIGAADGLGRKDLGMLRAVPCPQGPWGGRRAVPWCSLGGSITTSLAAVLPFQPDLHLWVNPIISLRSDGFANHHHSPCQSTARLGDFAHTPWLLLLFYEGIVAMPILMSTQHFFGVCSVILKHFLSFSSNRM